MPKIGSGWWTARVPSGRSVLIAASAVVFGTGCEERDRLTFPPPNDGIGPTTTIDQPAGADTTINAGSEFFVNGTTVDQDGIDTVYFFVIGGNNNFSPFSPRPIDNIVRFGLPVLTFGLAGKTIAVEVYGVDVLGNRGTTSTRHIHIR
jgi:hypothetical protein